MGLSLDEAEVSTTSFVVRARQNVPASGPQDLRLEPLKLLIVPLLLRGELKRLAGLSSLLRGQVAESNLMKHAKLWLTLMILSVKSEVADAVRENQWLWLTLVVPVWTPLAMLLLGRAFACGGRAGGPQG